MRRRTLLALLPAALLLACGPSKTTPPTGATTAKTAYAHASTAGRPVHWGYEKADGPSRWADLSPAYHSCRTGRAQSPVDLRNATAGDANPFRIEYEAAGLRIAHHEQALDLLDNGHTIQITLDHGSTIFESGESFDLVQYHFHAPSEHTVEGRAYAMELHFVHKSEKGELAVIGVLIDEGSHNPAFDSIWNNFPSRPGESLHLENVSVDIEKLLPESDGYFRYRGSLTTPPCSEGVHWFVCDEPIELSKSQIGAFRRIVGHNARPPQPLHGRKVVVIEGVSIPE
jgi:carbonic anhydrase